MNKQLLKQCIIQDHKPRSAWESGVQSYALEMVDTMDELETLKSVKALFNHCGYKDMTVSQLAHECSYGGCFEIYDEDIALRLCSPSEIRKCTRKDGSFRPNANARESWLDVQARALRQAYNLILDCVPTAFLLYYGHIDSTFNIREYR